MLRVRGVGKSFPGPDRRPRPILAEVDLALDPGETLALVGPSGCGKTTLLYILCGLETADDGAVELDGAPVRRGSPDVSIILQNYGLLPWKSVEDNVSLGLKFRGVGRAERLKRARGLLAEMGLERLAGQYPSCLSGGEQQRVAIARAYAQEPRLLLMDEPFSALDAITREALQKTLLGFWRRTRLPYLVVTHSVEEAVLLGRRIGILAPPAPGEPATVTRTFDNPGFGDAGYRDAEAYFATVRELRRAMDSLW